MGIDRGQGTVVSTNPLQLDSTDYDATVRGPQGPQGPAGHIAEGDISLNDGSKLLLGDSGDLEISFDGYTSTIKDATTDGPLELWSNQMYFRNGAGTKKHIRTMDGSGVTLFYDGWVKLTTRDYGASLSGSLVATGDISIYDSGSYGKLKIGNSADLEIYHDGVNNIGHFTYSENDRISVDGDEVKIYRREMTDTDGNANGYASIFISDSDSTGMGAAVVDTIGAGLEYSTKYSALCTHNGYFSGQLQYGTLSQISDERLKSDIQPITSALDTITQIQGITYTRDGKPMAGVTAQQLETVLPNLVHTNDPDGDCHKCPKDAEGNEIHDYKTVEYMPLISYLVEAVKELTEKVEALEAK